MSGMINDLYEENKKLTKEIAELKKHYSIAKIMSIDHDFDEIVLRLETNKTAGLVEGSMISVDL
jgi:hypothetical protein